jgi:hypothetical protein
MKYVTLMYTDPEHTKAMSKAQFDAVMRKHGQLGEELIASGELIGGMGMAAAEETTLLRLGADGVVAERGPLAAGAAVHVSAYYELECESDERAREIAARLLDDHVTAVELRSVHDSVERRRG